jgi:DNA-binding transcriptional LysR family regulator
MNTEQLIAFDYVVREGSFSRAAWALNIAQPTLSARIQALERELGGPLFDRDSRKVRLTGRGAGFLPYARQALAALTDGAEAARLAQQGQRGRLRVAVLRSLAGSFIAPALLHFHNQFPDVECYIEEGNHWQVVNALADGEVELGLIAWPCVDPPPAEISALLRFHEPAVLLAPKDHPLAQLERVTQADVIRLSNPFLLMRWWQRTPLQIMQLASQARQVADLPTDTGRYLLFKGLGAGFFTRSLVEPDLDTGRVVEIQIDDMPPIYRDSALVCLSRNEKRIASLALNFIDCIKQQARHLQLLAD